jgi:phosphopantothenoylcysteine decarboxylase/phosphopantothenate--cysteine ligase
VMERRKRTDVLIMAAAVADYRPAQQAAHKIKKQGASLVLPLEPTQDILAAVGAARGDGHPGLVVGFAAETENLLQNAAEKLSRKKLDLIVANDVSATDSGFEVDTNRVTLLYPDGRQEALPLLGKFEVAEHLLQRVAQLRSASHDPSA